MKGIIHLVNHPLFSGSLIMILGSNTINFLNYLYHLFMVKLLPPSSYGELASLISLIGLLGMIPGSLGLVITKFVSSANDKGEIKSFTSWLNNKVFVVSLIMFLSLLFFSPLISSFLNIGDLLSVSLLSSVFLFSIPAVIYRSVLQGTLKFNRMVISLLVESFAKLIIGVILVYLGFSVFGAVIGIIISVIIGWVLSRIFIGDYLSKSKKQKLNLAPVFLYSIPILVQSLFLTSFFTSDLILVKHFFPSHEAGIYAFLSTVGKIIFFGAGPITTVMFPIVSQRQAAGQDYKKIFLISLILTLSLIFTILGVYWVFPQIVIKILNPLYLEAAPFLIWFGVFISFFTLSSLLINYYLSLGKTRVVIFALLAAILQILGIILYHQTLFEVILVSVIASFLLLISLLIYFRYGDKVNISNSSGL